jgi:hypothetical protein
MAAAQITIPGCSLTSCSSKLEGSAHPSSRTADDRLTNQSYPFRMSSDCYIFTPTARRTDERAVQ